MAQHTFAHSQVVRCPIGEAPARLAEHFNVGSIGEPVTLDSTLSNRVRLTLEKQSQIGDADLLFDTHWTPIDGVPVPSFHGEFLVRNFGHDRVLMVIGGRIDPAPGPPAHRSGVSDVRREAIACARHFLADIRQSVETPLHRLW